MTRYIFSQEGQNLLKEHRECLAEERIGEMTLSAGTYLSEKFLEHPDDQVFMDQFFNYFSFSIIQFSVYKISFSIICFQPSLISLLLSIHINELN